MAGLAQLSLRKSSSALLLLCRFVCRLERRGGCRICAIRCRLPLAPAQSRSDARHRRRCAPPWLCTRRSTCCLGLFSVTTFLRGQKGTRHICLEFSPHGMPLHTHACASTRADRVSHSNNPRSSFLPLTDHRTLGGSRYRSRAASRCCVAHAASAAPAVPATPNTASAAQRHCYCPAPGAPLPRRRRRRLGEAANHAAEAVVWEEVLVL